MMEIIEKKHDGNAKLPAMLRCWEGPGDYWIEGPGLRPELPGSGLFLGSCETPEDLEAAINNSRHKGLGVGWCARKAMFSISKNFEK